MKMVFILSVLAIVVVIGSGCGFFGFGSGDAADVGQCCNPVDNGAKSLYAQWPDSVLNDPDFFPIMVWLQNPALAEQYKQMGINTYVGLWQGPTQQQLDTLTEKGMYIICDQNEVALENLDNKNIIAWMHGDEPDNYKKDFDGEVPLANILEDYVKIIGNDPGRPVFVNFGQGVANEEFKGRVISYDQYSQYMLGADIVSYDIYPVSNIKYTATDAQGNKYGSIRNDGEDRMDLIALGLERLKKWSDGTKPVWNVLECTAIGHPEGKKVTPEQLKAQVWMSIVHGSRGICWFVHEFGEKTNSAAILSDETLKAAVTENNQLVSLLAQVINSPDIEGAVNVSTSDGVPVDILVKKYNNTIYIFAVCMKNAPTDATFTLNGDFASAKAEVFAQQRSLEVSDSTFVDIFEPWGVNIYCIEMP